MVQRATVFKSTALALLTLSATVTKAQSTTHLLGDLAKASRGVALMKSAPFGEDWTKVQETRYILIGDGYAGLTSYVKQPSIRVCLRNAPADVVEKWKSATRSVIMAWMAPMRGLTSDPLAQTVEFVPSGCDVSVTLSNEWPHTNIVDPPQVYVGFSGYTGSYNILLHEFGHAFGMGDTYTTGSGICVQGQPQSVMCNTSFSVLQPDDIAGVQKIFKTRFPNDIPPAPVTLTASLGNFADEDGNYRLYFAYSTNDTITTVPTLTYCLAPTSSCAASGIPMRTTEPLPQHSHGHSAVYMSKIREPIKDQLYLNIRAEVAGRVTTRSATFSPAIKGREE
jgi:hypothetical protein